MRGFVIGNVVGLLLLGAAAGVGLTCWGTNKKVVRLQHDSDSMTVAAVARDSATMAYADSMVRVIAALQRAKQPVTIKIAQDDAAAAVAAQAVTDAKTTADSNVALVAQVAALNREVVGWRIRAALDSLALHAALLRGDVLQDSLHVQTKTITDLNERIQKLNQRVLPKWARMTLEVVRTGLAVKGLADVFHPPGGGR